MTQTLVRNLRDDTVNALKQMANDYGRSLQAEVERILEHVASFKIKPCKSR